MTAIRFTKKPSERSGGSEYEVGQVVDLEPLTAARWLRRGVAVLVEDKVEAKAKVETASLEAPERAVKPRAKPKSPDKVGD